MKRKTRILSYAARLGLVPGLLALTAGSALAQINGADPTLRLWLKADTLSGSTVSQWLDSSSWGTVLVPPPLPAGDSGNDMTNHTPQIVTANNNGINFQAVQFRRAFDPVSYSPSTGHLADRLAQVNNLDGSDPTLIDPSSDITMIAVYYNGVTGLGLGGSQSIFAKRGAGACPFQIGYAGSTRQHYFETYAANTPVYSGQSIPEASEWGILIMNVTSGGSLTTTEYYASLGGWHSTTVSGFGRGGSAVGDPFTIGYHVQPCCGYYETFNGQIAEFALYNRTLTSTELGDIQTSLLTKYFLQAGPPSIKTQPQNAQVNQFDPASFSVVADGTPPFTYQWYQGVNPISGATNSTYNIASAAVSDAGTYHVTVSNSSASTNSQDVTLTVIADTNKPVIASALLNYADNTKVTVTFSELVSPATATNTANYNINNSVSISSIAAVPQTNNLIWSNYVTAVVLTTSPITTQSTITANGVQDRAGNASANAQGTIYVPVVTAQPPSANMLLWLAADTNALAFPDGSGDLTGAVYEWDDMSGTGHYAQAPNNGDEKLPFIGSAPFPNAVHPVLNFYGNNALQPVNGPDFYVQNFSIYLVGSVDNRATSRDWLGSWEGWCVGTSDGVPGRIKWVTHHTGVDYSMEPAAGFMPFKVPALIGTTFTSGGNKTLSLNGTVIGVQSNMPPIDYSTDRGVAIGSLYYDSLTQTLVGDIAEILIYTNVSTAQDLAVQSYIASKYFAPSASVPKLTSATTSAAQNTNVLVVFSSPVSPSVAGNASHYAINNGVSVSGVTVINSTTVVLTNSPLTSDNAYTLTVNGITDWAGNAMAPNSQVAITGLPVVINAQRSGSTLTLTWGASGYVLQSADSVNGPWTTVTGATSPYNTSMTGAGKFYRLSQ